MTGTTFKRPNGRWAFQVDIGKDKDGRRRRVMKAGFATKREADEERAKLLDRHLRGDVFKAEPRTLKEFMEDWLAVHAEKKLAPKTVERYRSLAAHAIRALGATPIAKITPLMLETLYTSLLAKLSAKTVKHVHGCLHSAFAAAVRWKLLKVNPATACELKQPDPKEALALDTTQTQMLLDAAAGTWVAHILAAGAATGARRGEILALRWSDWNESTSVLTIARALSQTKGSLIVKTTKTRRIRKVSAPASLIECLGRIRAQQAHHRRLFGADYREDLDLIFCDPQGHHLKPSSVTRAVIRLAKKTGLGRAGLQALRHSHGSQLLSVGTPLPVVSRRLGHSSVYTTATVYSHALALDQKRGQTLIPGLVKQSWEITF